ncbi:neurogenic differentiation factor 4-like [Zootermopsis nevadensis]|uniref:Helix-loop-helix protein delilah n=1 Tax=Zootermopsis nevadensis TaxID=136037 RepID=A0A067RT06_ZOONE|nr:neurogenic differentiation factor 4-like [Zootermopsis nevadensis]XP_021923510.1 neurogenic differentiation factor 4-like [Zootermopsis nevadensis]KDR23945.1 Helix-loop-helix protein delilah [Zootermopsis nevadensis]
MTSLTLLPSLPVGTGVRKSVVFNPVSGKEQTDPNNNAGGAATSTEKQDDISSAPKRGDKYSLRPRSLQKRAETEQRGRAAVNSRSKRGDGTNRPKQKPPPLSKYRRKTANARERDRMREINAAFETLRRAVPHISTSAHQSQNDSSGSEKLTKITTLRLAMKYIAALSQALQQPDSFIHMSEVPASILPPPSSISSGSSCSGSLQLMSDGESLTFSEHCLTPPDLRQQSLTPPDFTRHCLTPTDLTPPDLSRHCLTPPDPSQHCLTSSEFNSRCMTPPDLSHQCLTPPDLGQHCLTPPHCLTPSDFADHSLTAADFGDSLTPHDFSTHSLTPSDFGDPCLTPPEFSDLAP